VCTRCILARCAHIAPCAHIARCAHTARLPCAFLHGQLRAQPELHCAVCSAMHPAVCCAEPPAQRTPHSAHRQDCCVCLAAPGRVNYWKFGSWETRL
jgi:hypothetical protein